MPKGIYIRKPEYPTKKEWARNYGRKMRKAVLEVLGNKCAKCGFSDSRALQIDHINGGGSKERKTTGTGSAYFYKTVLESFIKKEQKYQLLCANCNWIKRYENKEHNLVEF